MRCYTVKFVDHGNNGRGTSDLSCDDDAQAIAMAHRISAVAIGNGFDLWHQERLVYRHRISKASQAADLFPYV